ncbi:hypothetical protein FVE85_3496 [Porphyridium purpureum]|uniref:Uncharacterized protein n=1 Tax=Porphyridium purpureum TaxID=35688 RepID=A0A5J4YLC7_PORPP|nr:hypothetical protein FVE85_3496 [Porphyridium purpureum]|eukprot:POR0769..scf249_10
MRAAAHKSARQRVRIGMFPSLGKNVVAHVQTSQCDERRERPAGWSAESARAFVRQRVGGRGRTRAWYSRGEVVNLGTGAVVAELEGLEFVSLRYDAEQPAWSRTQRAGRQQQQQLQKDADKKQPADPRMLQDDDAQEEQYMGTLLSRKVLLFKDRETGAYMHEFRMSPNSRAHSVQPMLVPYQRTDVLLVPAGNSARNLLKLRVELNAEKAVRTLCHLVPFGAFTFDRQHLSLSRFSSGDLAPVDGSAPGAKLKKSAGSLRKSFWERYEWFMPTPTLWGLDLGSAAGSSSWTRIGTCPSWYGPGKCVYSLQSRSLGSSLAGVPGAFRDYLVDHLPMYSRALSDPAEIVEFQRGLPRAAVQDVPLKRLDHLKPAKRTFFKFG